MKEQRLSSVFDLSIKSQHPQDADAGEAMLAKAALFAPHLDRLFNRHRADLPAIINGHAETVIASAENSFKDHLAKAKEDEQVMAAIRMYRGRVNHVVAVTDLLSLHPVTDHLQWLSHAAEIAVDQTAAWLTQKEDPDQNWFILALGKLGAGELNYSSDIDLIIITQNDPDDHDAAKRFIQHTRRLTKIMATPTADGIGWRVDLRLRPDPGATPVAINQQAAMIYYESLARTWERAAFIRARPIGGDRAAGQRFLNDLSPFIWRRYFDYTVLDDLKIMLRRESRPEDLLGFNVKNGIGGIRSIEFFVHAQQLIAGGRESNLRQRSTLSALEEMRKNDWIDAATAEHLAEAYLIWRRLEHRLQMMGDAQTHHLPKAEDTLAYFAQFCGFDDLAPFKTALITLSDQVTADTHDLIKTLLPSSPETTLLSLDDESLVDQLSKLGYDNPQTIINTTQGWLAGRIPATRSTRAREVMQKLLPKLLSQCAETESPDASFAGFVRLVESLPAGLQLFSLMDSNDDITGMIMAITLSAPTLADDISKHPILADSLLYRDFWRPIKDWPDREVQLLSAINTLEFYEDGLSLLRRQCREWKFQISTQLLQGVIDGQKAGADYTAVADAVIRCALPLVYREINRRFGDIPGGSLAVMALGRCGAEEMTVSSDLDLIFIYDHPEGLMSDGKKSLDGHLYYSRFSQELINALSSLTAEGRCYEVDMRLRPSGNSGPVAVKLDGFEHYQRQEAWLWEHLALVKSRIIGGIGADDTSRALEALIPTIIKSAHDAANLAEETHEMRTRLQKAHPPRSGHDLRHLDGGIMDIDLLMAMRQLHPEALDMPLIRRSIDAANALEEKGLLEAEEGKIISAAAQAYTNLIHWMRLTKVSPAASDEDTPPLPKAMAAHFNAPTMKALDGQIASHTSLISPLIKKYIGKA